VRHCLFFGVIAIAVVAALYPSLYHRTDWKPHTVWFAAFSGATLVVYGLDKGLSVAGGPRAPERLLHMLAMLGGFAGGWLGMFLFRHKINLRKHPSIWLVLLLSTLGHMVIIYCWFF
jgi:uncharacterized membrane protein YsdA (DUF1294 family)